MLTIVFDEELGCRIDAEEIWTSCDVFGQERFAVFSADGNDIEMTGVVNRALIASEDKFAVVSMGFIGKLSH